MHKIAIIGLGLIGGSIIKGLQGKQYFLSGYDIDPLTCSKASSLLEITEIKNIEADLIIIAVPPHKSQQIVNQALQETSCPIIIDTNSFMSDNSDSRFFPTHPMAGKASSGFDFSTADLFQQAVWAVTKNNSLVNKVIADLGATPVLTTIEEHDQAVARYSHLIQIVASSIAANDYLNAPQAVQLSGPAYKDVTRVAASDADFWQAIFQANKDNILPPLNQLITVLQDVLTCLENGNYEKINELMKIGNKGRDNLLAQRWSSE